MTTNDPRAPVAPGEPAPDFTLPAVDGKEPVSLADYRGKSPVFLGLLIGLWCPFCRRQIAKMGANEAKLKALGVETLGVVATEPENAQLYFKFPPTRPRRGADPGAHDAPSVRPAEAGCDRGVHESLRDDAGESLRGVSRARASSADARALGEARRLRGHRDGPVRDDAAVSPAQGPVPDRPRRHRAVGQHRVRPGGHRGNREISLRPGDPGRRAHAAALMTSRIRGVLGLAPDPVCSIPWPRTSAGYSG